MTVHEIWKVNPQGHTFIRRGEDDRVIEYTGNGDYKEGAVLRVKATSYPMYKSVIEITLKKLYAEYIDYMDAYRMFFPEDRGRTVVYADDLSEAKQIARSQGRELMVIE